MTIAEFQQHILTRYGQRDKERGVWPTFGWFMEEVGELCQAILHTMFEPESPKAGWDNVRKEAVQCAAVGLSLIESFDRKKWEGAPE